MRKNIYLLVSTLLIFFSEITGQVTYTALDSVVPYNTEFLYGTNPGYYNSNWTDIKLSDIARKIGIKTYRPTLPEWFVNQYGYDIRMKEFAHYQSIGFKDNTIFLDIYNPSHPDVNKYGGCADKSLLFANLYENIWDGGANGTPVNENNYYALYVYKVVSKYKNYAKFWEIINEPDYCLSKYCADKPGIAGNWWENPPAPCDLKNLKAPIFHYIRMLKISYEVIKSVDPTAYVCLGGIGYKSFLDALLRYTDNPVDGSVTVDYPLKGGAYFDVVSYHAYPQYNLAKWNGSGFSRFRFSDAVADTVISFKKGFEKVLISRGFNGITYPKKHFIVTEYNIPRVKFSSTDHIGSVDAQRNAMIKTMVNAQKEGILQLYSFLLGDQEDEAKAAAEGFGVMGFYYNLTTISPGQEKVTPTGTGLKTLSTFLEGFKYDPARTTSMNLTSSLGGGAFKNPTTGKYRYVLWARTKTDNSETASSTYSFPASFALTNVTTCDWNVSLDATKVATLLPLNIPLTGTPLFISEEIGITAGMEEEDALSTSTLNIFPNPSGGKFAISLNGLNGDATLKIFAANGTLLRTQKVSFTTEGTAEVNSLELPKGIYMAQIQTGSRLFNQRLIIE
jgi:hypothetical protein